MACKNVHVIHLNKESTPFSAKKKYSTPQLKKTTKNSRVKIRTPPPLRNQMGRPLCIQTFTYIS